MKKFFALIIGAMLALSIASAPALARNDVVNKWFQEGGQIDPIQGGTGVAHFKMTRPDNGATMYFEKCWEESKGWACLYEVVINGDNSHHDDGQTNNGVASQDCPNRSDSWPDQDHCWNGEFESVQKNGSELWATVTVDGDEQDFGPYSFCKKHNGKQWCY